MMKICVTTSNAYAHIVPIFAYLFNKHWDSSRSVEIVGYDKPSVDLPANFSFHSMGVQSPDQQSFSRDLRKYFAEQDQFFIWCMEDCFIKRPINFHTLGVLKELRRRKDVGRINLGREATKQDHVDYGTVCGYKVYENTPESLYRLSTQPSIWNREFALANMQNDLSPWEFECQSDWVRDKYHILGMGDDAPVVYNEGVRKRNIHLYNFDGIDENELRVAGVL